MKEKLSFAFQNVQCFRVYFKCFEYEKLKHIAMGRWMRACSIFSIKKIYIYEFTFVWFIFVVVLFLCEGEGERGRFFIIIISLFSSAVLARESALLSIARTLLPSSSTKIYISSLIQELMFYRKHSALALPAFQ